MKLGARVLKTGVAIVFALFLAQILNVPSPVFAAIAAVFAIQPSIYRSYLTIAGSFYHVVDSINPGDSVDHDYIWNKLAPHGCIFSDSFHP